MSSEYRRCIIIAVILSTLDSEGIIVHLVYGAIFVHSDDEDRKSRVLRLSRLLAFGPIDPDLFTAEVLGDALAGVHTMFVCLSVCKS